MKFADVEIKLLNKILDLGVILDDEISFGPHVDFVVEKAEKKLSVLTRILPNVRGSGSKRREVLLGVIHSILLYGGPA